jgi:Spy/CpxP family protein refolding chaperone
MTPLGRRRLWFALFVVIVFALGAATGFGLARFMRPRPPFGRGGPGRPPPSPAMVAERMTHDLGLTPEQRTKMEQVLRRNADRLERFHATTGQQYDALRNEIDADIERVLTPEQIAKFRTLRPPRRGGGPPPPFP